MAIGGIARPSSRLAAVPSGTSSETVDGDSVLSCPVAPAVAVLNAFDLKKLCLKKLDNGLEAPPGDREDESWLDGDGVSVFCIELAELGVAAATAAAFEVL